MVNEMFCDIPTAPFWKDWPGCSEAGLLESRRLPTDSHDWYFPILCIEIDMLYIECGQTEFMYQHSNSTLYRPYWSEIHEQSIYDCLEGYHVNFQRTIICMYMWVMGMNVCLRVCTCTCVPACSGTHPWMLMHVWRSELNNKGLSLLSPTFIAHKTLIYPLVYLVSLPWGYLVSASQLLTL